MLISDEHEHKISSRSICASELVDQEQGLAVASLLDQHQNGLLLLQVKAKVLSRYKHVKVILSHAGGYLPYQAARIGLLAGDSSHGTPTGSGGQDTHKFYFDTALSGERFTGERPLMHQGC